MFSLVVLRGLQLVSLGPETSGPWFYNRALKGKALKAYMALSDIEACSYENVKKQVLQADSLVPKD